MTTVDKYRENGVNMEEYTSIEELLDDLIDACDDYIAQLRRENYVCWSEENEKKACDRYYKLREKIIDWCRHEGEL